MMNIRIGEIYWVDFGTDEASSIIKGIRPAIVVKTTLKSTLAHVVPLTTSPKKRINHMHVKITDCGLIQPSIALIEQVRLIDKSDLKKLIGSISETKELNQILQYLSFYFKPGAA